MSIIKKNLSEYIVEFYSYFTVIWIIVFFGSLILLGSKYEYVVYYLGAFAVIPASGVFIMPFLYPAAKDQEIKRNIEKSRQYRPIIQERFTVQKSSLNSVQETCLKWLEDIGARFIETDNNGILAYHEVYDTTFDVGVSISKEAVNLPKVFRIRLSQDGTDTQVTFDILPGWQIHPIDGVKKREEAWKIYVHKLKYYLNKN
ncbi:hypothetical protein JXL21_03545 [Candidatus Bathyarchaeota archaeon]|nr:hypothetical protein [Candidatus Bathyarchaeota archaeon]